MKKDPVILLRHILDCIARIQEYSAEGRDTFFRDTKTQDAIIRNLEVIGQAVKDLNVSALVRSHAATPWTEIAGLRNVLAHQYLGVDVALVWNIVEKDLLQLKTAVTQLIESAQTKAHE